MSSRRWAYDTFARINETFFENQLPWPEIRWDAQADGSWLGWCDPIRLDVVVIHLHPLLLETGIEQNPWQVPGEWLGERWAGDMLLHEAMHVQVTRLCAGRHRGTSPHDNDYWIAEVNRLAPMLGFPRLTAGRARQGLGRRARPSPSRVNVAFDDVRLFPFGYRRLTGTASDEYTGSEALF